MKNEYRKANGALDTKIQRDSWNYSRTLRLVKDILAKRRVLGPLVRVWHDNGKNVRLGFARGEKRVVLGGGGSFFEAIDNVFIKPMASKLAIEKAEGEAEQVSESPKHDEDSEPGEAVG